MAQQIADGYRVSIRYEIGQPGGDWRAEIYFSFFCQLQHDHRSKHFADACDADLGRWLHRLALLPVCNTARPSPRLVTRNTHGKDGARNVSIGNGPIENA